MAQIVNLDVRSDGESYKIFEQFKPLKPREIRLINLQPGGFLNTRSLECSIIHQSLDGTPQFEALSYCWGDAKPTGKITCDGQEFKITDSLETAFKRIRHSDRPRTIWADFLCINQKDDAEKASQVRLMTDIYRKATNVVAWVGGSSSSDEDAMDIGKLLKSMKKDEYPEPADWRIMKAFTNFFQRPWFGRMWIIQEVGVATKLTLYCGKYEMDWQVFSDGVNILLDNFGFYLNTATTDVTLERIMTMLSIRNLVTEHASGQQQKIRQLRFDRIDQNREKKVVASGDLLRFARNSRLFGASDPRDRIYALLGLVQPSESHNMKVSYDKDCREIFKDFVRATILQTGTLDVLCQAGIHQSDLPSWIPDLTRRLDSHSLNVDFYVADSRTAVFQDTTNQDTMLVSGYVIDTISFLEQGFTRDTSQQEPEKTTTEEKPLTAWRPGTPPTDTPQVFEKTVVGLTVLAPLAEMVSNPLKAPFRIPSLINSVADGVKMATEPRIAHIKPELEQKWRDVTQTCQNRYANPTDAYQQTLLSGMPFSALGSKLSSEHRDVCYQVWRERLFEVNPIVDRGWMRWVRPSGSGTNVQLPKELKKLSQAEHKDTTIGMRGQEAKLFISRAFSREVDRVAFNRQFCRTESGYMGWVPGKARLGDLVCILKGGKVPFVLRKADAEGCYILVGEAYVHGVMMGEIASSSSALGQEQRFVLI